MTPAEFARYCVDNWPATNDRVCYLAIEEFGDNWGIEVEVGVYFYISILAVYQTDHEATDDNHKLAVADRESIRKELTALGVRVCSTVEEWEKLIYPEEN